VLVASLDDAIERDGMMSTRDVAARSIRAEIPLDRRTLNQRCERL
jgi:hypothetical protein